MTEKRYYMSANTKRVEDYGSGFYDNESNSLFSLSYKEVCDLLNENEDLKKQNKYLKSLKWNLDCINEISTGIQQKQYLEKENKQLKSILYDIIEQLECEITPNEDILYTHRICVIVDEEMYQKIQKIIRGNFCE